jgi:hypothetical protein
MGLAPKWANNLGVSGDAQGHFDNMHSTFLGYGAPFDLAPDDHWGYWDLYLGRLDTGANVHTIHGGQSPLRRLTKSYFAIGAGAGGGPRVQIFDSATKEKVYDAFPYEASFTGGVQVAVGDVNGDGYADIITGTGVGGGPRIVVINGADFSVLSDFFAYESSFRGGVMVAAGDLDGDGVDEIIAGSGVGGGPVIKTFNAQGQQLSAFLSFDESLRFGVNVTAGDFNGDGKEEIAAALGAGGGPEVRFFDINGGAVPELSPIETMDLEMRGGLFLAAGDVDRNGRTDLIVASGGVSGPRVQAYSGSDLSILMDRMVLDPAFTGGVRVATTDLDGDNGAEIVVAAGPTGGPRVRVVKWGGEAIFDQMVMEPSFAGGLYVGGSAPR